MNENNETNKMKINGSSSPTEISWPEVFIPASKHMRNNLSNFSHIPTHKQTP